LLTVSDLSVGFPKDGELTPAVENVSFEVGAGETLAIVGESGCGKTVTGLSLIGLTPPPGQVTSGRVMLDDLDLLRCRGRAWEAIRGRQIGMIFQDPLTALDPVYTAGEQIAEGLRFHLKMRGAEAWKQALASMADVGIPDPPSRSRLYPHQLSGGMRQRVMIAAAIALKPRLLIADEPTTALDVTVQLQIIELLQALQREHGMGLIIITHDLGVVARIAHRVAVMYAGQIVEQGDVQTVLETPAHPYTAGLVAAIPRVDSVSDRLATIEGTVPAPGNYPPGCRFRPRCPRAAAGCELPQELRPLLDGRTVRCLYPRTDRTMEIRSEKTEVES